MMENDLISRKKLIDDLEAWRKILDRRVSRFDDMVIHTLPVVFDLVNEQKTVAAEPKWISVKERLPEDDEHYLVWCSDNNSRELALYYGDGEWLTEDLENITRVVTHWMPLPEPPKMDGGAE